MKALLHSFIVHSHPLVSVVNWQQLFQGSGAPCPALFESLKEGFSSLIDFGKVDDPSFRPRIFLWAATGCPTIDPTSSELITVSFYYVITCYSSLSV